MNELQQSYSPPPTVSRILRMANYSGLCLLERCLQKVPDFSHYRGKYAARKETEIYSTSCRVRVGSNDEWKPLKAEKPDYGFIKFAPNLCNTPPTTLRAPDNVLNINKCLASNEERISSASKMKSLPDLRNFIYNDRTEQFHWIRKLLSKKDE